MKGVLLVYKQYETEFVLTNRKSQLSAVLVVFVCHTLCLSQLKSVYKNFTTHPVMLHMSASSEATSLLCQCLSISLKRSHHYVWHFELWNKALITSLGLLLTISCRHVVS